MSVIVPEESPTGLEAIVGCGGVGGRVVEEEGGCGVGGVVVEKEGGLWREGGSVGVVTTSFLGFPPFPSCGW